MQRQLDDKPASPIPLDYGHVERFPRARREAEALGGWPQATAAVTLGLTGVVLGWLPFRDRLGSSGAACLCAFLGAIGFLYGLFMPLPADSHGWRRVGIIAASTVGGAVIGLLVHRDVAFFLGVSGYRVSKWILDEKDL